MACEELAVQLEKSADIHETAVLHCTRANIEAYQRKLPSREQARAVAAPPGSTCTRASVLMTVAYGIMISQKANIPSEITLAQFSRLLAAVYDQDNTYTVHVDDRCDTVLVSGVVAAIAPYPNVVMIDSTRVAWGGVTIVERMLALVQTAYEMDSCWSYFTVLSHEDYPNASQMQVRQLLSATTAGTNFVSCADLREAGFAERIDRVSCISQLSYRDLGASRRILSCSSTVRFSNSQVLP